MKKLHLMMPMGGGGTRFGNKGFNLPKPLIELKGKPFFYWAAQSVMKFMDVEDITFIILQEHLDRFKIDKKIIELYPMAKIRIIPQVLNGAVLTCREGIRDVSDDYPILFNDCDHAFICKSFYDFCDIGKFDEIDGALLTFNSSNPNYSYVCFDENKNVVGTIEKKVVSGEAICGAYYFKNKLLFDEAVEDYLHKCEYKEFFVSGVYNIMAEKGKRLTTFPLDEHISFGTPDEYDIAMKDVRIEALMQ